MKKRIRDFYEDNKTICNITVACFGVAAVMTLASRRKAANGNGSRPTAVDLWQLEGGGASMIIVQTKDGLNHQFIRDMTNSIE